MKSLFQAIWTEMLKARRSKVPLVTAIGFSFAPFAGGFFMIVLKDPELARQVGLISTKAQITAGSADWPSYIGFLCQAVAVGGILLFSIVISWIFGREYSDHTIKDLLALPVSRSGIVFAKYIVFAIWCLALTILIFLIGLVIGAAIGLPQGSFAVIIQGGGTVFITALLTILVIIPIGFFASAGHGYLAPVGAAILLLVMAQVVATAGWGDFFPWSIPALFAGMGEAAGSSASLTGFLIVLITGIVGMAATFIWWEWADQTR